MTYASSGLVSGDSLTGTLTTAHGGAGTVLKHANGFDVSGSPFAITQGSLDNSNYTITYTGNNLALAAKAATVTADDANRNQGAANPTFTAAISGFVGGEVLGTSGITGSPALTTAADTSSAAGTYVINASVGSLSASNYSFGSFINGVLTVNAVAGGGGETSAPTVTIPNTVAQISQNPEILTVRSDNFIDWRSLYVMAGDDNGHATPLVLNAKTSTPLPDNQPSAPTKLYNNPNDSKPFTRWLDSMRNILTINPALAKRLGIVGTIFN